MKKLLSIILLVLVFGGLQAQIFDTMRYRDGRCPRYHYTNWYDTTSCYRTPSISYHIKAYPVGSVRGSSGAMGHNYIIAKQEYAPDNMFITGVAILVKDSTIMPIVPGLTDTTPVPDTCYLFTYDTSTHLTTILGAVRWDTASPKIWQLPMNADSSLPGCFQECKVYEAMFPTPVAIDSDSYFLVMATVNCNEGVGGYWPWPAFHIPKYFARFVNPHTCNGTRGLANYFYTEMDLIDGQSMHIYPLPSPLDNCYDDGMCGFYLPIGEAPRDTVVLTTAPADPATGYTTPTRRRVPKGFLQTIEAHSNDGYIFTHWNDGSTENPRRVRIWDTAHYVAYFVQRKYNVVTEAVGKGYVEGGGDHASGDTVELRAIPRGFHIFRHWQDGDTNNPRRFVITSDTAFCAHFTQGPYTIIADAPDGGGTVDGGGVYEFMDTVILTAYPFENYSFSHWEGGYTSNPDTFLAFWPGTYHAYFNCDTCGSDTTGTIGIAPVEADAADFFTLTPNPTTGKVTVTVGHTPQSLRDSSHNPVSGSTFKGEQLTLTLRDAAGHEVLRKSLPAGTDSVDLDLSHLPAGAYFVTLSTPASSATQRLVVK